jgi:DtxR family Mn-dependent transcriptional regulator
MNFTLKTTGGSAEQEKLQKLTPAMEDYLKNIYSLEQENRVARVSDISKRMNVRKASVVSAVRLLQANDLLKHEKYGFITLTDRGRAEADILRRKYNALYDLFVRDLKVTADRAAIEACAAEHALSADTVARIKALVKTTRRAAPAARQKKTLKKKKR